MKLFVVYLHCWVLYLTPKNYLHYNNLKPFKQTLHPYHNFVFPNCDVEQIVSWGPLYGHSFRSCSTGIKYHANLGIMLGFLKNKAVRKIMAFLNLTTIRSFFNGSMFFVSTENVIVFCHQKVLFQFGTMMF